jgi:LAO/AO transport system kinase
VDIARLAHTTVVVEAPGLGDDIQAIKAGILEIADVLAINKADRPGVENTEKALKSMLDLAHPTRKIFLHHGQQMVVDAPMDAKFPLWIPPIQRTVATEGKGIEELADAIAKHATHLRSTGEWSQREHARLRSELEALLQDALMKRFREDVPNGKFESAVQNVYDRSLSPWEAVQMLVNGRKS